MESKKKQIFYGLTAVLAFVLIMGIVKTLQIRAIIAENAGRGAPPQAVTSFVVRSEEWPVFYNSVGSLRPVQGALLSAEEPGRVARLGFDSGSRVKKGDLLVALDASAEDAELAGAKARLQLAELTAKRQKSLRERNATSQSSLDSAESERRNLLAEVQRLESLIRRKTIIAPFDGKAGIRSVNVGQTIAVGDPIISVSAYEKLYVDFSLPQTTLGKVTSGLPVFVEVDAFPNQVFQGTLTSLESRVDTSTRNIALQASLDNSDEKLLPGMFVKIRVELQEKEKVLSVPATSVQYAPYGDSIYLIEAATDKNNPLRPAVSQNVKLGRRLGDRVSVLSGLSEGQEIVSSGTFKMHPGVQVMVNNSVEPKNELSPNPENS